MWSMNLEGLEMIAVLVVVVLFVKVLDRFGLLAASYDGKGGAGGGHLLLKLLTLASRAEPDSLCSAFEAFNHSGCFCLGHQGAPRFVSVASCRLGFGTLALRESPAANWRRVTQS